MVCIGVVSAAPLYYPGQTLNPGCSPTNPDCTVTTSTAATLQSATDAGNITTRDIQFAGATSTNTLVVDGGNVSTTGKFIGDSIWVGNALDLAQTQYSDQNEMSYTATATGTCFNCSNYHTNLHVRSDAFYGNDKPNFAFSGIDTDTFTDSAATTSLAQLMGLSGSSQNRGSGHIHDIWAIVASAHNNGSGSASTTYGMISVSGNYGSGRVGTAAGLFIENPNNDGATGPTDNNYGIYIQNQAVAGATNYALYTAGGNVDFENGNLAVNGGSVSGTSFISNGTTIKPNITATTISFGDVALTTGTCTSTSTTVTGATTGMAIATTPVTYPGDGVVWQSYVSSANVVTTKVCVIPSITPIASVYNLRVIQ